MYASAGPLPGIGKMLVKPWGPNPNRAEKADAKWSLTSPVEIEDVTDGTTHTVLLGEKSHLAYPVPGDREAEERARRRRTFLAYTYTSYQRSLTFLQTRSIISDYARCEQIGGPFGTDPCKRSWGSLHTGGFNVAMCDGSIQFLSESIDIFLFGAMSTVAGGEVIQTQ